VIGIWRTSALVVCVIGVAACTAATPTRLVSERASRAPTAPAPTAPAPTATASPAPSPAGEFVLDLGNELTVWTVTPEFTATVLEHASTGAYVLLSAGPEEDAAPDLWAVTPGPSSEPELLWRNEERDRSLVKLGGDLDTILFVDMPVTGEVGWNLWLIPEDGADAILLDRHPGGTDVPSLVPSFTAYQPRVAWTAFDAGPDGPVSQLLTATAPDWEPQVVVERPASEAELWFPSVYGNRLVYSEVRYSADRTSDERHAYLIDLAVPGAEPVRLDASGLATMPLINQYGIIWKEADPGFNMLNWGVLYRYDPDSGLAERIGTGGQEYVNYPSIGERFAAWWGEDPLQLEVYDLELGRAREIVRYPASSGRGVVRPHVGSGLLVWRYHDGEGSAPEIRYAYLPVPGSNRLDPP
jgi:hypothetical protein